MTVKDAFGQLYLRVKLSHLKNLVLEWKFSVISRIKYMNNLLHWKHINLKYNNLLLDH